MQANDTCAEVGCDHPATTCCDECGRRFCHIAHVQRRHRVTPTDPKPPYYWTWHIVTFRNNLGEVTRCADCSGWFQDEDYGFERSFPTEIQDAHHALEYDFEAVHWEEAIDEFIQRLEVVTGGCRRVCLVRWPGSSAPRGLAQVCTESKMRRRHWP